MSKNCNSLFGGCGTGNIKNKFDDPFLLPSSEFVPESMSEAFDFCRFLYFLNPEYRRASQRTTRHFITSYEISNLPRNEQEELKEYLDYTLKLRTAITEMADDWSIYGNAFMRIHYPFKRMLYDASTKKRTRVYFSIESFSLDALTFDLPSLQYVGKHPETNKTTRFNFLDLKERDKSRIRISKYDPRHIDILYSEHTSEKRFIYKIPKSTISQVQSNSIFHINNLSKPMLTAIKDKKNFLFSENEIFHFHAPIVSGVSTGGWGLPEPIANFRLLYQIQVYRKIDEAVGLDYMLPFRMLSLDGKRSDGVSKVDAEKWGRMIKTIIDTRRKDKTAMFGVPFPVEYQEFGANGKQLSPKEMIEYQINNMLNAMGYPAELYNMSLQVDQFPGAIRLFENTFWFLHEGYNNFCKWAMDRVNRYLNNQPCTVSMARPTLADDADRQNVLLQLGAQGELPRGLIMRPLGVKDPVEAYKERLAEDMEMAKAQMDAEAQLEQELAAEQSLQAALQSPEEQAQSGEGVTPQDVEERAHQKAMEWGAIPSDGERRKAMDATRAQDYQLYALAKQILDEMRAAGAAEGRQAANQQMQEGGAG